MARLIVLGIIIVAFILVVRLFFPASSRKKNADATEMVKDPNCETYVPKAEAVHLSVEGRDYYFCGNQCADEFKQKTKG